MTIMQIQYGLGPCLLVFPESITLHWVLHKELLYLALYTIGQLDIHIHEFCICSLC